MDLVKEFRHLWIYSMAASVEIAIALFYPVASIIVVGLIRVQIPDGGNRLGGEKVFEEKKLTKVSNITGVAVLQRGKFRVSNGCNKLD